MRNRAFTGLWTPREAMLSNLSPRQQQLYGLVMHYSKKSGLMMSNSVLEELLQIHPRNVQRNIRALEKLGLIRNVGPNKNR